MLTPSTKLSPRALMCLAGGFFKMEILGTPRPLLNLLPKEPESQTQCLQSSILGRWSSSLYTGRTVFMIHASTDSLQAKSHQGLAPT